MPLKEWWLLFCHGSLPQSLICSRSPGLRPKFMILVVFKSSHHKVFSYTSSFQAVYSVYPSKWCLPWTYMAVFWVLFVQPWSVRPCTYFLFLSVLPDCSFAYKILWTPPQTDEWTLNTMWHSCPVCLVSLSGHSAVFVQVGCDPPAAEVTDWQNASHNALLHSLWGWPARVMYALKPLQRSQRSRHGRKQWMWNDNRGLKG